MIGLSTHNNKIMKKKLIFSGIACTCLIIGALLIYPQTSIAQEGIKHQSAYNNTQGRDATTNAAQPGDVIEYTLTFNNTTANTQSVVIEMDVSDILSHADIYNYNGAYINGNLLNFPSILLSPGARAQRTFVVRVKDFSSSTSGMTMSSTYGDAITITLSTSVIVGSEMRSLSAYNTTQGRDAISISARPGDIIEYTLTFHNKTGSQQTESISLNAGDILSYAFIDSITNNGYQSGSNVVYPSATVNSGSQIQRTFRARIKDLTTYSGDLQISATYGNQIAITLVPGSSPASGLALGRSKSAYNQTQGQDAQAVYAKSGDTITYSLTYWNQSTASQNIAIEDDITDVLYLADLTNNGGAFLNGNILRFPSVAVPANTRLDRSFQVRVKSIAAGTIDNVMSNYYGNGVDIHVGTTGGSIPNKTSPIVKGATYNAPGTGPKENLAVWFALLLTAGVFGYNKIKQYRTA